MRIAVTAAVVASWLPLFERPVGENDLDVPYQRRLKARVSVEADHETLADVYRRAIDAWKPQAIPGSAGYVEDPADVVYWAWFYDEPDEDGIGSHKAWEVAEQLITVDVAGCARWRRNASEIPYADFDPR